MFWRKRKTDAEFVETVRWFQERRRTIGWLLIALGAVAWLVPLFFLADLLITYFWIVRLAEMGGTITPTDELRVARESGFAYGLAAGYCSSIGLVLGANAVAVAIHYLRPSRKDRLLVDVWDRLRESSSDV